MFGASLSQRAVISISGEGAVEFLQGLISNDARLLTSNSSIYAALLSPQGRFLHDFFLIPWLGKIFIDVRLERANDLLARLKMYRLRSKLEITIDDSLCVAALWAGDLPENETPDYRLYQDPRFSELGIRAIGRKNSILEFFKLNHISLVKEDEYESFRLSLGIPDTCDMIVEKSLLLECGFEELNGVDFSKGCYVGQEVTARSKFRGQVRKSFYSVTADESLPAIGAEITLDNEVIGEMRTSKGNMGIAIVYNDKFDNAKTAEKSILCDAITLKIMPAKWSKKI